MTGKTAANVPSKNCSAPPLIPVIMALVRSCGDMVAPPYVKSQAEYPRRMASALQRTSCLRSSHRLRIDNLHGRTTIGQITTETAAGFTPCLCFSESLRKLGRTLADGLTFSQRHNLTRPWTQS